MQEEWNRRERIPGAEDEEITVDVVELLYRLLEKAKYIVLAALIGAGLMTAYSFFLATPMYEATSKVYVLSNGDSAVNLSDLQIGSYLTSDYQEAFNTWEVHELVLQNLGLNYSYTQLEDMISVQNPSNTRILNITAHSDNPQEASALANEYARVASEYISETMKTDQPTIFSQALTPTKPYSPRTVRNAALGFIIGALIAGIIIVIQFLSDDKIKTSDDIRRYTDLPTLAIVPVSEKGSGVNMGGSGKKDARRKTGGRS